MSTFTVSIEDTQVDGNTIQFKLMGNEDYGLDKSIVNSLRRTLMSEIPSVAFRVEEGTNKDIVMDVNNTSLHNEFLLHRISMIPIYLDPKEYKKQYLFYLNVKHDGSNPFKFVTTDDIQIFPLKNGFTPGDTVSMDDYDMLQPLSKQERKEILRSYTFRGKEYPILLTELKSTNVEGNYQELSWYGVPSLSDGRENAAWKAVSDATYVFLENEELFMKVAQDKAGHKKIIDDQKREEFIEQLRLAEAERYYYRDSNNEAYKYLMTVTAIHFNSSRELFIQACNIMIDKLTTLKQHCINLVKGGPTTVSIQPTQNESNYVFTFVGQNDTIGNVLQSHIVNHYIDEQSFLGFCGYKKSHPLEEYVNLYVGINPTNEAFKQNEEFKLNAMVKFMDDVFEDLMGIYRDISKEALKSL